ncbi:hypothetical protein HMPREF3034_02268 [Prevotella sp. DNF00663]|nr:hypothetical protein HMPREF3034_02268 [Prevotella sp. DNF00663]
MSTCQLIYYQTASFRQHCCLNFAASLNRLNSNAATTLQPIKFVSF